MDAPLQSVLRTMMPDNLFSTEVTSSPEIFARNIDEKQRFKGVNNTL